jgi:hypothetical protein
MRVTESQSERKTLLEDNSLRRIYWQSAVISVYSVLNTFGQWIQLLVGNNAFANGGLDCVNEKFILVTDKSGAMWLLVLAIFNIV